MTANMMNHVGSRTTVWGEEGRGRDGESTKSRPPAQKGRRSSGKWSWGEKANCLKLKVKKGDGRQFKVVAGTGEKKYRGCK